ncbi:Epidermal patterning factor-like protein [Thalictrum thalictroides]|uniref:Epidermal patterning factor-like protein n=1 Tax=Thalictrum thalictroides TaxID=46969 RepID=A0A7J6WIS9_THATH|nr:Epidermal patterning factor-like protein [Thalictrum thalictroides]
MGFSHHNSRGSQRYQYLIISMLFLLISSSTHVRYMVEGRPAFKLFDQTASSQIGVDEVKTIMRSQIGSRPPRCERRCNTCGHCEAIQVPANPSIKSKSSHSFSTVSMRGDYGSNYKPMSWKCKCGDMIFNP